jgi:hypothetical protein
MISVIVCTAFIVLFHYASGATCQSSRTLELPMQTMMIELLYNTTNVT